MLHIELWHTPFVHASPLQHGAAALHVAPWPPHIEPPHTPFVHEIPGQHGFVALHIAPCPPHIAPWHTPLTQDALQHSALLLHVLPVARQHAPFAPQVRPLQQASSEHDWPAPAQLLPPHVPVAALHDRPGQQAMFGPHGWPWFEHMPPWHSPPLQLKPTQHG